MRGWLWVVAALVSTGVRAQVEVVRQLWDEGAALYQAGAVPAAVLAWQEALAKDPGNAPIREKIELVKPELVAREVVRVVDGQSLVVRLEAEEALVRLNGVDPGVTLPGSVLPSEAAATVLRELVEGKQVYVSGAAQRTPRNLDGSVTGSVYLAPDLTYVNAELLRRGVARAGDSDRFGRAGALQAAEVQARSAQLGMWTGYKPVEGLAELPRPYRNNGRLMVPLRPLVAWLGARLTVYPSGRVVAANSELAVVTVPEGETGQINGKWRELDTPMEMHRGVIFTPVHLLTAAAGAQATALSTGEVHLKYKDSWTLLPGA